MLKVAEGGRLHQEQKIPIAYPTKIMLWSAIASKPILHAIYKCAYGLHFILCFPRKYYFPLPYYFSNIFAVAFTIATIIVKRQF
jgi:hypothetical protein